MASPPKSVLKLVETFDRNIDAYHSQQYNETQLRREFVDPFFEALGWDVSNKQGYAQAYKEVIHEDAVKVGAATKAPDYSFRIGGTRKFFLEAKKPSIDIKGDPHPAYQLRRYAWSAKLPLSILTDFEEFAVYDCRMRPKPTDGTSTARIMFLTCKDYIDKWDEIADIFSKDAILKGSFDKFAVSAKAKRGTTTVDKEFLAELEKWRAEFARIIALRNTTLSAHDINFAVQRTIDRIIFLRMCEDRGIEHYGQLQAISNGSRTYPRLCEVFERADEKYNSGLFHFHQEKGRAEPPDELTLNLAVDDAPLKYVLHSLYYPLCPYEFSVLPAEILGNVYEQFLGSVIQVSQGRRTKVEPKPEVKKAGGIYYTPDYIVDYIVKNTVGKLLCHSERKKPLALSAVEGEESIRNSHCEEAKGRRSNLKSLTPPQVANLRILDPACGSGSFLLGAYTYLLNYHRDWYVENDPKKHTKQIYQGRGGLWFLTIAEKKKILLNNIFGVDIDSQAVEVTKLSLLLKVLEGESQETIENQMRLFRQRALPDLGNNIKCGNSLIGPDFFNNPDVDSSDDDLRQKINPFDWHAEFPQIFKQGGFDAIIGNPPYIQLSMAEYYDKNASKYFSDYYSSSMGRLNTFGLFIENVLKLLLGKAGLLSFIVPNTILTQEYYQPLRQKILKLRLDNITTYQYPVFENAVVETIVFVIQKTIQKHNKVNIVECDNKLLCYQTRQIQQDTYLNSYSNAFLVKVDTKRLRLKTKLDKVGPLLKDIGDINQAIALKSDRSKSLFKECKGNNYKPVLDGRNIQRYALQWDGFYLSYDVSKIHSCKRTDIFEAKEKIFFRRVGDGLIATYDDAQFYALNTLVVVTLVERSKLSLKYVLGLLNSHLMNFYYITYLKSTKKIFSEIQARQFARLPIRTIDFDNPGDKARHDKMVKLVDRMLELHKKLTAAKVPDEKTKLQRQIFATDSQIDQLTYDLYNLTPDEIKIVEE
jgi:type I restriction-modification system DNA methylase subunit